MLMVMEGEEKESVDGNKHISLVETIMILKYSFFSFVLLFRFAFFLFGFFSWKLRRWERLAAFVKHCVIMVMGHTYNAHTLWDTVWRGFMVFDTRIKIHTFDKLKILNGLIHVVSHEKREKNNFIWLQLAQTLSRIFSFALLLVCFFFFVIRALIVLCWCCLVFVLLFVSLCLTYLCQTVTYPCTTHVFVCLWTVFFTFYVFVCMLLFFCLFVCLFVCFVSFVCL